MARVPLGGGVHGWHLSRLLAGPVSWAHSWCAWLVRGNFGVTVAQYVRSVYLVRMETETRQARRGYWLREANDRLNKAIAAKRAGDVPDMYRHCAGVRRALLVSRRYAPKAVA